MVRYGNVRGSRGSVLTKEAPRLTDARATRFWMEPEDAVFLVLTALSEMQGGEIFVPKLRASRVADMAQFTDAPGYPNGIGLRPGEKLHETLISAEEVPRTWDYGDHYRILPNVLSGVPVYGGHGEQAKCAHLVPADFRYCSEAVSES